MRRSIVAAAGATALLLAGCGGEATPNETVTVTRTVTATVTPDAASTAGSDAAASGSNDDGTRQLGQQAELGVSNVRVLKVMSSLPKRNDQGEPWMAALVQQCFTQLPGGGAATVSWGPWSMSGADGSQYPASGAVSGNFLRPQYPFTGEKTFSDGDCAKGWVGFPVPTGAKVATIDYSNQAGDSASWHVAKNGGALTSKG